MLGNEQAMDTRLKVVSRFSLTLLALFKSALDFYLFLESTPSLVYILCTSNASLIKFNLFSYLLKRDKIYKIQ